MSATRQGPQMRVLMALAIGALGMNACTAPISGTPGTAAIGPPTGNTPGAATPHDFRPTGSAAQQAAACDRYKVLLGGVATSPTTRPIAYAITNIPFRAADAECAPNSDTTGVWYTALVWVGRLPAGELDTYRQSLAAAGFKSTPVEVELQPGDSQYNFDAPQGLKNDSLPFNAPLQRLLLIYNAKSDVSCIVWT